MHLHQESHGVTKIKPFLLRQATAGDIKQLCERAHLFHPTCSPEQPVHKLSGGLWASFTQDGLLGFCFCITAIEAMAQIKPEGD